MPSSAIVDTSSTRIVARNRFGWYSNSRYWVIYSDATNLLYNSSADNGSTWPDPGTTIASGSDNGSLNVFFDGTYVHYAYCAASANIRYRRGTPDSGGTITWTAEQNVASGNTGDAPSIAISSDGYAYIVYTWNDGANYYPYVVRNDNTDGTWSTTSGYPQALYSTTSDSTWKVFVVPLTSGKMMALYGRTGQAIRSKLYSSGSWAGEGTATTVALSANTRWCCTSDGDDVHVVWDAAPSTYHIYYRKYTGGAWAGTYTDLLDKGATGYNYGQSICADVATHDLYVFTANYPSSSHVYYIKYTSGGSWDGSWTDWITDAVGSVGSTSAACYATSYNSCVTCIYNDKATPYNIINAVLVDPAAAPGGTSTIYMGFLRFI